MQNTLQRRVASAIPLALLVLLPSVCLASQSGVEDGCLEDAADTESAKMVLLQTGWEVSPHGNVEPDFSAVQAPPAAGAAVPMRSRETKVPLGASPPAGDAADTVAKLMTVVSGALSESYYFTAQAGYQPQNAPSAAAPDVFRNFCDLHRWLHLTLLLIGSIAVYYILHYMYSWTFGVEGASEEKIKMQTTEECHETKTPWGSDEVQTRVPSSSAPLA
eukprot:CAMPEP_0178418408 /NCGR_PEP_ID=MMETSP0689_2-20121128/25072_1 /TAXON_ID=160604 /ORGANISM="Amphidinium massartii, Strain CS-259" /LENGTH=217 /DNA_ID=CAMNT_0020039799 /DNA_START=93 /DNA_END=746 /DNA_ORIENTATION=-